MSLSVLTFFYQMCINVGEIEIVFFLYLIHCNPGIKLQMANTIQTSEKFLNSEKKRAHHIKK